MTRLVHSLELSLLSTMNPDRLGKSRENAANVDLNRGFPGWQQLGSSRGDLLAGRQPEVAAVMQWTLDNPFLLSANLHDGSYVVNYPWDDQSVRPWELDNRFSEEACTIIYEVFTPKQQQY